MKTLICSSPRHFEYGESAIPEPTAGHVLLKIERIGICGTDLHAFEGTQPFFSYPRILGHELAAELVEVKGSSDFAIGERVTIVPYFNCGNCVACRNGKPNCCTSISVCGVHEDGGMVEYLSVPSYSLVHGQGLDIDLPALIEPLAIGAHAVQRAGVKPDEYVAVVGAGPIGMCVMEFARLAGAHVIAIDMNEARLTFCREKLHVDHTINSGSDPVEQLRVITRGDMPAVVVDATGNQLAINNSFHYMTHGGRYVLVGLQKGDISFSHPGFHKREGTLMSSRNATRADFDTVIQAIKKGLIHPEVLITHRVKFDNVRNEFENWLNPASGIIKVMVEMR